METLWWAMGFADIGILTSCSLTGDDVFESVRIMAAILGTGTE